MKRLAIAGLVLTLLIVGGALLLPRLLSSEYVKQRVERQLEEITGQAVTLKGGTSLSLSPYLGMSFQDVEFISTRDSRTWVTMDGLKARLRIFPALIGGTSVNQLHLVRPRFGLSVSKSGKITWPGLGRGGTSPEFGTLVIENGSLIINGDKPRVSEIITELNGTVSWPAFGTSASADISGKWRSRNFTVSASSPAPERLIEGEDAPLALEITSDGLSFDFDGRMQRASSTIDGTLSLSLNNPEEIGNWLGITVPFRSHLPSLAVNSQLSGTRDRLQFENVELQAGENKATGQLQLLDIGTGKARLVGTFATDSLALLPPKLGYSRSVRAEGENNSPSAMLDGLGLDVRLSANSVKLGDLELESVAATATIMDNVARLDLGQVRLGEGILAGSIVLDERPGTPVVQIDLNTTELQVDLAGGAERLGITGTLSGDVKLSSQIRAGVIDLARVNGEGKFEMANAEVSGLDLDVLASRAATPSRRIDRAEISGESQLEQLSASFHLANGITFLDELSAQSGDAELKMSGQADIAGGGLAMRATLSGEKIEEHGRKVRTFLIGGSHRYPLVIEWLPELPNAAAPDTAPIQN